MKEKQTEQSKQKTKQSMTVPSHTSINQCKLYGILEFNVPLYTV